LANLADTVCPLDEGFEARGDDAALDNPLAVDVDRSEDHDHFLARPLQMGLEFEQLDLIRLEFLLAPKPGSQGLSG
jgi:hypothetical protein